MGCGRSALVADAAGGARLAARIVTLRNRVALALPQIVRKDGQNNQPRG